MMPYTWKKPMPWVGRKIETTSGILQRRRSKYGSRKTEYNGQKYDSKKEADYARILDVLRNAVDPSDRVVKVERQVLFLLMDPPNRVAYRLDFRVTHADGSIDHVEVKGFATPVWRMKLRMFRARYPEIKLIII